MYDVIIIGGAAAGSTAGIYAARRKMKTLILTKDIGGQASITPSVENYPGFLEVPGFELMQRFQEQAIKSGAEIIFEEVVEIREKGRSFFVKTQTNEYEAKALILTFGKTPRSLNVPGEKEFLGKGVSYCATCDLPVFRDKTVAVVGGGNSALDAALYGSEIARKLYLIHRRDKFRGFEYLVERVKEKDNVEFVLNSIVTEIKGEKFVKSIIVKNVLNNTEKEIDVDGIFIEIGYETKVDFVKDLVKLDEQNQVMINKNCETFYPNSDKIHPGIFAAGDLTDTPFKQIVISAGEGAKAALQAYNYIHCMKPVVADWSKG
ncbi:MAG: FAD-dependent oxidoreductase [Candidatus Aenigmarchaeota archaeon]|nr:FAD-dependent oxidoreductase [Candidatus Aenigmarchaeota archaeon]